MDSCINLKKVGQVNVRPIFILSTGRAGTNWLSWAAACSIPSSVCVHEAPPCVKYLGLKYYQDQITTVDAADQCLLAREPALTAIRRYFKKKYYIEANQSMFNLAGPLSVAFPNAQFIGLIRDASSFVTSMMNKNVYNNGYKYLEPKPNTEEAELWDKWSLIQKLSWHWKVKVEEILKHTPTAMFCIEDLWGDCGFEWWNKLWRSVSVPQYITSSYFDELKTHVVNKTRCYSFPSFAHWSSKDKDEFYEICFDTINKVGYC